MKHTRTCIYTLLNKIQSRILKEQYVKKVHKYDFDVV
jgi:hypothetical protein